jgi:hypothetical protein
MADYQPGELRSFKDFSKIMGNFPYLTPIDEKRRNRLLSELYDVAVHKCLMEASIKSLRDKLPKMRATRRRSLKAAGLLREARQAVSEARALCGDDLAACEEQSKTIAGESFTFDVMENSLNFSAERLEADAAEDAVRLHPQWCTDVEKRLARKYMEAFDYLPAPNARNLPSGEKALALDAWFMSAAAACIDKYKSKNRKLEGYDIIIAKLFDAAFILIRTQASVQKALKGRRKKQPQYSLLG